MNSEAFTWWLQGFFELTGAETLNQEQVKMIKEHLALVFTKVTSELGKGGYQPSSLEPMIPPATPVDGVQRAETACATWDKEVLDKLKQDAEEIAKHMNTRMRSYCSGDWSGAKIC